MKKTVEIMEPNGQKMPNFAAASPADGAGGSSPAPTGKFTYPSGSRPLEGYTIKRGVGYGGFGEIYYAINDAGKEVALKLIRRNLDVELRGIRQCLNIKHPNLIDLYDIRQDAQGDTWVVMEYLAGDSLQDAVENQASGMPVDEALAWIHGIGNAVAYLHDHGIVHRDLKPGNVFSNEGVVKVGDYGLSKFISCSRRSGHTESIGTVHYMAPEVANGRYGKEIDVYAMGVILYELLTGQVPFDGESVGEVLMKHLTAKPDVSMLAEPYRTVVVRALEKDTALRYGSASEMLAALPQPKDPLPGAGRLPSGQPNTGNMPGGIDGHEKNNAEAPSAAQTADEEPILKAVKQFFANLRKAWREADLPPWVKLGIICVAIFLLLSSGGVMFSSALTLFFAYCVYRLIRALIFAWHGKESSGQVPQQAPQAHGT
ncbi:MAG: serine/threonine-protein kinase, partial [Thermoguttaceae bacterium]